MVREVLLESNVVPIFAVSAKEKPTYEVSVELKNVLIKEFLFLYLIFADHYEALTAEKV